MFQKVHLYLTLLCAGITAAIMIIMSLCYLYISEQGLYRNYFNSFKNDMNTIATSLEQQSVISMEWLSKMEAQGNYTFFVLDNGIPFLYNRLNGLDATAQENSLLTEILDTYQENFLISPDYRRQNSSGYNYTHIEFEFTYSLTLQKYYVSVIEMRRNSSILQIAVLSPLTELEKQISDQRIRFILIDITAIFLLTAFSFIFTRKLLNPIQENQQKQAQFVASASHELRTPLAVIMSSAECCKNASPSEQNGFLQTIHQEGKRMATLIEEMLTLSQSDSQYFPMDKKPVELDTLLMNAYEAFDPLAKEKGIALSIRLPENALPMCYADGNRIYQVISILLHNAISYTPEKGRISISLSKEEKHSLEKENFVIRVRDTGIGISDEDKKKIFDRFYRAEKARSTKGHFGLGLSIAYEIVKMHHGNITVQDNPEGGCLFTVTLPCKQ